MWAQGGCQERLKSLLVVARGGAGGEKIFGTGSGSVLARKADREEPPGDALGLIQGVPEVAGDRFWRSFLTVLLKSSFY